MERFSFEYPGGNAAPASAKPTLTGVLGSGNLEVLVTSEPASGFMRVDVVTAAVGFQPIWRAVIDDAFARWRLTDVHVSINDAGATPAVVALRLDQALEDFTGRLP